MTDTFSDDVLTGAFPAPPMAAATKARYSKPQPYLGVLARFPRAILEIAKVSKYGTVKHQLPMGDMSYLDVPEASVNYVEAEVRHLLHEAIHGAVNNDDGGLFHKAQKAWEALADLEVFLYQDDTQFNNMEDDNVEGVWPGPPVSPFGNTPSAPPSHRHATERGG